MSEVMTLEQACTWLRSACVENYPLSGVMCGSMADAIDAHLAKAGQPVEAVDVENAWGEFCLRIGLDANDDDLAVQAYYFKKGAALAHPRPMACKCGTYCQDTGHGNCRYAAPTGEQAGDVVDWTDNDVETLRNLRDAVGKYANLKKLWVPTIDKMLARARHVDNPAFMPYAKPRPVGVPDPHTKDHYEQDEDEQIDTYSVGHMDGWNSCREAMLAAAPARGEGGEA